MTDTGAGCCGEESVYVSSGHLEGESGNHGDTPRGEMFHDRNPSTQDSTSGPVRESGRSGESLRQKQSEGELLLEVYEEEEDHKVEEDDEEEGDEEEDDDGSDIQGPEGPVPEGMSRYEWLRSLKIKRNQERLEEIGLGQLSRNLFAKNQDAVEKKKEKRRSGQRVQSRLGIYLLGRRIRSRDPKKGGVLDSTLQGQVGSGWQRTLKKKTSKRRRKRRRIAGLANRVP